MQIIRDIDDPAVRRLRLAPAPGQERIVLSGEGLKALANHIDEATADKACRAIVLEGTDGAFCEGMDLSWLTEASPDAPEWKQALKESMAQFAGVLEALATAPLYVVVCVDGVVRAGGIGLVAAADEILATSQSSFGLPEVMLGLIPAMVLPLLCARMPEQKARRWAMTGGTWDAQEALTRGLVDVVVDDADDMVKARKRALRQILRMQPDAVATCKSFCQRVSRQPLAEGLALGADTTGNMIQDDTRRGWIKDFLDGEPLPWFARYRTPTTKS